MSRALAIGAGLIAVASCAANPDPPVRMSSPGQWTLQLAGEFNIQPLTRFPVPDGPPFGGVSGLVLLPSGRELLAVCDDGDDPRVYRLAVEGEGPSFRVIPTEVIRLENPPGAALILDAESLAVTADGRLLIASEGQGDREPWRPPALLEFGLDGKFIRHLAVRSRFTPAVEGPIRRGVRDNAAFESLTIAPGGRRLFTATETALTQDGNMATVDRGTPARLLEYVARGGTFEPAREFVYPVEPVGALPFEPGFAINGLVDLVALNDTELLALERSFAQDEARVGKMTRIRLFRVWLDGASDVAAVDSLVTADGVTPVRKQLLLDLGDLAGLSSRLSSLDNFEGLAFGPRLADGSASLLLVSDDNFDKTQLTSFLLLRISVTP